MSQETCLMLEERLPKKVQFLIKRGRPLYQCLLSLESRHFYLWNAQCGTVQRPDGRSKDSRFWQAVTAFSLLRPARFSDAFCAAPWQRHPYRPWHKRPLQKLSALFSSDPCRISLSIRERRKGRRTAADVYVAMTSSHTVSALLSLPPDCPPASVPGPERR